MRKVWIYAMQIALPLVMVVVSATGCAVPSSTSAPASKYPAHIIGHVTIAEKVKCLTAIAVPPSRDSDVFWIVDIAVKNNAYSDPVVASFQDCYKRWVIIASDETFRPVACGSYTEPMTLALGETGQFMIHFSMPETLHISDAQICYQGQEPYSYGKLTGGDKVAAYDWDLKAVVEGTREPDQYEQYFVKKEVTGHKKVGKIGDIDITEPVYKDIYMKLETVGHWEKATSGDATPSFGLEGQPTGFYWLIGFNVSEAPWVVNWGYEARKFTPLDPVGSKATFEVSIFSKADFDTHFYKNRSWLMVCHVGEYRGVSDKGVHCKVVQKTGHYVIVLNTKDVKDIVRWWVKVGVE